MNFKKYFLHSFICVLFSTFFLPLSKAQYTDLLDNPNITWIAEFSTDHSLSIDSKPSDEVIQLLKYSNDNALLENTNKDNWVINWIIDDVIKNHSTCYSDPGLTQVLSKDQVKKIMSTQDTIVTFSPETYLEQLKVIKRAISSDRVRLIRANQIIYYNAKTKNFETRLISVAPLFKKNKSTLTPLLWINMNESVSANLNQHSPDITWAALAYSIKHPLELNFIQEIKNKNNFNFLDKIYQQAVNKEKAIYKSSNYSDQKLLSKDEILTIYNSVDTVTTFDPETYQEEVRIYHNSFSPRELSSFRLLQEWYYDQKKRKLMNRLVAISPLLRVKNEKGEYKYTAPLYYINYELSAQ